jgi:hypothetical protein
MTLSVTRAVLGLQVVGLACAAFIGSPPAQADPVAYGRGLCARVGSGERYAGVMADVKSDFNNTDDYQASYLINQAVNELCPGLIWQLRHSAAHHQPPTT